MIVFEGTILCFNVIIVFLSIADFEYCLNVEWQFRQMQLLVQIIIVRWQKDFLLRYLKVILIINFTVFLVTWWGRSVKRRKRLNKCEVSLAEKNK